MLSPLKAMASTAAWTPIVNTANVDYQDAGGNQQARVSASVTVTVSLVAAAPTVSSPPNPASPVPQGSPAQVLNYTITSNANGSDSYNITSAVVLNQMTAGSSTATPSTNNVTLGGTTLAAPASNGNTSITVPYDGDKFGASNVNNIGVGQSIVIGGAAYVVSGITKNAAADTASITLASAINSAPTPIPVGTIIGEQKQFTVSVTTGTISGTFTSGTETVTTTGTEVTNSLAGAQATATVITVVRPLLTVSKEVSADGGNTFPGTPVTAAPGTILTYRITATNGGTTPALNVKFNDPIPPYLTYVANSGKSSTTASLAYTAGSGLTTLTDNGPDYTTTSNTVNYTPTAAGTVPGGGVLVLYFQAKINP
jgi:uncharacterized repeat protein (TIGR01451 family)